MYYVIARNNGKVLDVDTGGWGNRRVHQVEQLGQGNQRWSPVQTIDGYYFLFVEHSGKCLEVEASRTVDKAPVVEYQFNGTDTQKWILYNYIQFVEALFPESAIANRPVTDCLDRLRPKRAHTLSSTLRLDHNPRPHQVGNVF